MSFRFFVIILLIFAAVGGSLKEADVSEQNLTVILHTIDYDNQNITFNDKGNDQNNTFINRGLNKFIDFTFFLIFEGGQEGIRYGYNNSHINFKTLAFFLIITAFAGAIIPLIYLLTFLGYLIILINNKIKKWRNKQ